MIDLYQANENYHAAVAAIVALQNNPCPFAGKVTAFQVILALGEIGGIWPMSVQDDLAQEQVPHVAA